MALIGSSEAGVSSSLAVWSGMRSVMAPRLTRWLRARVVTDWPPRYAAYDGGLRRRDERAAAAPVTRPPLLPSASAARNSSYVSSREFASGSEGLHHELHSGQQFSGARVAGGEVHRGERASWMRRTKRSRSK